MLTSGFRNVELADFVREKLSTKLVRVAVVDHDDPLVWHASIEVGPIDWTIPLVLQ